MDATTQQLDNLQLKEEPLTQDSDTSASPATCPFAAPSAQLSTVVESTESEQRSEANKTPVPAPETVTCPVAHSSPPRAVPALVDMTQEIDPELLRTSLEDRVRYLRDFLNFHAHDAELIKKVGPLVYGLIPKIVDDLYAKLFEFDITKQVFMQRNEGFDGPLPTRLEDLTLDSAQLIYRKIFMKTWARRIMTMDYTALKSYAYLDKVGIMHTGVKSFKHRDHTKPLHVPYRDIALTLGWVLTVLQTSILQLSEDQLSASDKVESLAAINKVIWIQNDLFARHYISE